jgi:hypothetical protein
MIDAYRGNLHVQHGGLLYGFTALVSMLPNEKIGLVVLTNLNNTPLPMILEGYVYDRLLELPPIDWNKRRHEAYAKMEAMAKAEEAKGDPDRNPEVKPTHKLGDYAGLYHSEGYGDITVRQQGDSLMAALTTGERPLRCYNGDTFELYDRVKRLGWKVTFHGEGAKISTFSVELAPDVKDIVFTRQETRNAAQ